MVIPIQTDGFIVLGKLENEEGYPCLICKQVPEFVMVDLFAPEPNEIPATLSLPEKRQLVLPYRLCPKCAESKPRLENQVADVGTTEGHGGT